jgi:putative YhdH/YhfP family quinone oxidoreductase
MKAIYLTKDPEFRARIEEIDEARLPEGDVLLKVDFSSINYKDGLAITNKSPVVRVWPMVAGIDGAGTVEQSSNPRFQAGDRVILTSWGVGEVHWGCLATKARLKADWLVKLPFDMMPREAMAIGTAGFTAMLCTMKLEDLGVKPESGEILVTGAAGGVGSVAIAILSRLGYRVVASTGRLGETEYLQSLGASEVMDRKALSEAGKPLQKERWAGVVDSVGSHTLANACAQAKAEGVVTACGLAQGMDLPSSVAPFILRGVTLAGINSVTAPRPIRERAWDRLAKDLDRNLLASITGETDLAGAIAAAPEILAGKVRGRLVVDVNR